MGAGGTRFALVKTVDDKNASISDVLAAVNKYVQAVGASEGEAEVSLTESWLTAELSHRFDFGQPPVEPRAGQHPHRRFLPHAERIIASETSQGNIGGKGAGLFIASQILKHAAKDDPLLKDIKTPRMVHRDRSAFEFLSYNNMKDLNAYKYNSTFYLRRLTTTWYPKSRARNCPRITHMLRIALDDGRRADHRPVVLVAGRQPQRGVQRQI